MNEPKYFQYKVQHVDGNQYFFEADSLILFINKLSQWQSDNCVHTDEIRDIEVTLKERK